MSVAVDEIARGMTVHESQEGAESAVALILTVVDAIGQGRLPHCIADRQNLHGFPGCSRAMARSEVKVDGF